MNGHVSTQGPRLAVFSREWVWVILWALVLLGVTSAPYIVCAAAQTADYRFGGLVYDVGDIYTYLAEMRQGARGAWLLHLPFTSEDHPRALIHPLYLILGKVAGLTGASPIFIYHAARLLSGLFLLMVCYAFFAYFVPWRPVRRLAYLLTCFSSGLGWLILILAGDQWLGDIPIDFWVPEAYTLPVIYGFPHIALSVGLLLLAVMTYLHAALTRQFRWAVVAGGLALLLVFLVPFDIAIIWGAIGAYVVVLWIRRKRSPWDEIIAGAIVAVISAPGLLYNWWVFAFNPAFREWARQNPGFSPHPLHFVVSLAFLGLLAVAGMAWAICRRDNRWLMLVGWAGVALFLVYLPFNLQRRLIAGLHPVLCLFAAIGLALVAAPAVLRWPPLARALQRSRRYSRHGVRRLLLYAAVLFTMPSNLLLLAGPITQAPSYPEPIYQHKDKVAAVAWLAANTPAESIVLSSVEEGNYIPAWADNWVYVGHGAITSDYERKWGQAQRFFGGRLSTDEARTFLARERIAYVYFGPRERSFSPFDMLPYPFLHLVYKNDSVEIYEAKLW